MMVSIQAGVRAGALALFVVLAVLAGMSVAGRSAASAGGNGVQQAAPPAIDGTGDGSLWAARSAFGQCGSPACDH